MFLRVDFVFVTILIQFMLEGANCRTITCVCTTSQCREQNTEFCTTAGKCYTQYLDLKDGSDPLLRGCIMSKTPLLCENRRPAVNASWPLLVCCNTNMCNQDAMPTMPPRPNTEKHTSGNAVSTSTSSGSDSSGKSHKQQDLSNDSRHQRTSNSQNSSSTVFTEDDSANSSSRVISPVYIAVLVVGICSLIIIGVVAVFVLRRHGRLYESDYGHMERNSYLKGHHQVARDDPELQMPLPRAANGIYDNKLAVGT